MRRSIFLYGGLVLLIGSLLALRAPDPPRESAAADALSSLAWLAGAWSGTHAGVEQEEHWLAPKGGTMLGLHRDFTPASGKVFFEFLRIVASSDGIEYLASPSGQPPTAFRLMHSGENEAVFENPEHDYPQRIVYRLEANGELVARIEGSVNGSDRSSEWRWKSATPAATR